jgi:hypothetical protein
VRIPFATGQGGGHFGPLVPFARECERAGHEVLVAAPAQRVLVTTGNQVDPAALGPLPANAARVAALGAGTVTTDIAGAGRGGREHAQS